MIVKHTNHLLCPAITIMTMIMIPTSCCGIIGHVKASTQPDSMCRTMTTIQSRLQTPMLIVSPTTPSAKKYINATGYWIEEQDGGVLALWLGQCKKVACPYSTVELKKITTNTKSQWFLYWSEVSQDQCNHIQRTKIAHYLWIWLQVYINACRREKDAGGRQCNRK